MIHVGGKVASRDSVMTISDQRMAFESIEHDCHNLQKCSLQLRDDEDVVLAAISRSGYTLKYASKRLQDHDETVLTAVSTHGGALQFASRRLRKNSTIVLSAIQNDPEHALRFVDPAVWEDLKLKNLIFEIVDLLKKANDLHSSHRSISRSEYFEDVSSSYEPLISADVGRNHPPAFFGFTKPNTQLSVPKSLLPEFVTLNNPNTQSSVPNTQSSVSVTQPIEPHLITGRQHYQQYIQEHPELTLGRWVSIVNDDYKTARDFATYEDAAEAHENNEVWFCEQYRDPSFQKERIFPISAQFGFGADRHPDLAYINVQLSAPTSTPVPMKLMVDTGATVSMGTSAILIDQLQLKPNGYGTADGLNGTVALKYVNVCLQFEKSDSVYRIRMGYIPNHNGGSEDWLLGQNFLKRCKHVWIPTQPLEIHLP